MPLKITGRHPPLIDIAIYILIVHTEDIKYFSFLFHCRTGITENNRTRGIRSLHPIPAKLEICTINTFVTDTPKQDRRMRTESFHHFLTLSQITVGISRITLYYPEHNSSADKYQQSKQPSHFPHRCHNGYKTPRSVPKEDNGKYGQSSY